MLKIARILLCSILIPYSASAAPPKLALAKRYHDQIDVTQYFVSEKLDGVRGYWDGTFLYTRNGNRIHSPPEFTKGWPEVGLDGELWIGRGRFEEVSGIVRRRNTSLEDWRPIRFMVFDLHGSEQSFSLRLDRLREMVALSESSSLQLVEQIEVESSVALEMWLDRVVEMGGEGLMLHKKSSIYQEGRSDDILKLKPHWDAEARVIAHIPGKGKYLGALGSLLVEGVSDPVVRGKRFKIGTGFSNRNRRDPPVIGSIVTYRFNGYTRNGVPRFASFLRVRCEAPP